MKDRNAWTENRITRGVDPDEVKVVRAFGVPWGQHEGLVEANPQFKGVPEAEARGLIEKNYRVDPPKLKKPVCRAITKLGLPCKASPVAGERLCVGHSRVKV